MKDKFHNSILFVNQSSGYLMIDIINAFEDKYAERILLTGLLNARNNSLDKKVLVRKIIAYNRTSSFKRILTWSIGFLQTLFLIKFKYRNAHLFLVSNPPFAPLLPLFCNNQFTLLIYDVYPDALVEHKIIKSYSWINKCWKKANRKLYAKADKVFTISNGMKRLLTGYIDGHKITVIPVWTDNNFLKPIPHEDNPFSLEHGLADKFIVMYSGNLGRSHDLEVVLELASQLEEDNITFLIIGSGDKSKIISDKIKDLHLKNIKLLPWQPTETLPFSLASADVAIVSLSKESSLLSVPSKTFNFMSVGVPILAIAEKESELAVLIKEYQIGVSLTVDQKEEMIKFIKKNMIDLEYHKSLKLKSLCTSKLFSPENAKLFTT